MNDSASFRRSPGSLFSATDIARLNSWALEIAGAARGEMRGGSGEWRFGANQALVLHQGGWFYDFSAGRGGQGALALLAHLHDGAEAGETAARAWLAKHIGDGKLGRSEGDDGDRDQAADDAERIAYVKGLWGYAQPLSPEALKYLNGRGLDPVATGAEAQLRWLADWRGDEGAMLAAVTGDGGELLAVQVTSITPEGEKSPIEPKRVTIRGPHDWRSRGAFRLGNDEAVELVLPKASRMRCPPSWRALSGYGRAWASVASDASSCQPMSSGRSFAGMMTRLHPRPARRLGEASGGFCCRAARRR
jgi:hypothetical protein